MHERETERSESRTSVPVRSRVRAAGESAMSGSGTRAVCNDADDDGFGKRAVRGAVERGWMWVLPERDDDHLSGIRVGDGYPAAEAR